MPARVAAPQALLVRAGKAGGEAELRLRPPSLYAEPGARAPALRDALVETQGIGAERLELGEPLRGTPGVVVELIPLGR